MRYLSEKQARAFFEDIVSDEWGSFSLWMDGGESVMINGRIVKDWRDHSSHGVLWYNEADDSWSATNLSPQTYWAVMEGGHIARFVDSLEYAMLRCGFGG